jgi:hypothetical protein
LFAGWGLRGGRVDSDQDTTHTVNLGMGCSVTCDCCGNQCHSVKFVSGQQDLWWDTDAEEFPKGETPRKLLVFFHDYRGDSTRSTSKYYLDQLVQEHNYLLVAPEGRYVRPRSNAPRARVVQTLDAERRTRG